MKTIPFIKMHGCGNDYVYLDGFTHEIPCDIASFARRVSDRHQSVGGDGVVLMLPPKTSTAVALMRMFNSDGSEGSLCGNALRCMALWLHQIGRAGREFQIEMGNRVIGVEIVSSDSVARNGVVRVQIGRPIIMNAEQPGRSKYVQRIHPLAFERAADRIDLSQSLELLGDIRHVSMGNPHTILFLGALASNSVTEFGPMIERHSMFPDRTNVEFAEITGPSSVTVRVWERGSGETRACGSGACAVAVAGIEAGLMVPDSQRSIEVRMLGGTLRIVWADDDEVFLEGPAEIAFEGTMCSIE